MRSALLGILGLVAWLGALQAGPRADLTRIVRQREADLSFVPDPVQTRVAATGFEEAIADLFWVQTIIVFGGAELGEVDAPTTEWMRRMIETVNELDPSWRTAYYYGGVTLRVLGDVEGSDEVFERGTKALPDESFCPFSIGMNAFLYRDDPVTAARWLALAGSRENAPRWYHAAAAAMQKRGGSIEAGLHYLREVLQSTTNESVRKNTLYQIGRLEHDQLVATWAEACRAWRERTGSALAVPEDLARVGFTLPPNPTEGSWVVGGDGVVRADGEEAKRLRKLRIAELRMIKPLPASP